ncbi:ferritin-like domain-containing protein [Nitrospinota bacterium]
MVPLLSSLIHDLCDMATEEKNHPVLEFLSWFVKEQVEEEKSAHEVVEKLKLAGDSGPALLMLDKELGTRLEEDDG